MKKLLLPLSQWLRALPLSRWLGLGIVIAFALSVVLLADEKLLSGSIRQGIGGDEHFKLVLQFLLITVAGGAFVALINARKDKDARRQAQMEAIQSLDRELSRAYRSIKRSRRRLRSRCDLQRMHSKKDNFEACTDELLAAQISLEEVEDNIEISSALLRDERYGRINLALHYAARYLHDVFEDFEKGHVERVQDGYVIVENCKNLRDFLLGSSEDRVFGDSFSELCENYKCKVLSPEERHEELFEIEKVRKRLERGQDYKYRYRKIAFQCVRTVALELRTVSREITLHRSDAKSPPSRTTVTQIEKERRQKSSTPGRAAEIVVEMAGAIVRVPAGASPATVATVLQALRSLPER